MTDQKLTAFAMLQAGWGKAQFVPAPAVITARLSGMHMQDLATLLAVILLLVQIAAVVTANWERWRHLPGKLVRWIRRRRLPEFLARWARWARGVWKRGRA